MAKLYICRGCPASGKTTWAKKEIDKRPKGSVVRVNRDDIRRKMFDFHLWKDYKFTRQKEERVTKKCNAKMMQAAMANQDVIVDNTNLNYKFYEELVNFAQGLGFDIETVDFFDVPLEKLIQRNIERELSVPEVVIHDMYRRQLVIQGRRITPQENKPECVVVDIDGTIADMSGIRGPYDWDKVGQDKPKHNVIRVVESLSGRYDIVFLSGRDGQCYGDTQDWLLEHTDVQESIYQQGLTPCFPCLYMREAEDCRPDTVVKEELLRNHVLPTYNIAFAIDDRKSVCDHYRALGLEVWQVDRGMF